MSALFWFPNVKKKRERERVLESQENMCKEGKEAGTRGQFKRIKTIQLILSRLMILIIRGKVKMLNSRGEIAIRR